MSNVTQGVGVVFLYFIMLAQLNSCTSQKEIADSLRTIAAHKESQHGE